MIYMYEGLNGAGKSTIIKDKVEAGDGVVCPIVLSDYANYLKWPKPTFTYEENNFEHNLSKVRNRFVTYDERTVVAYNIAVFETLAHYLSKTEIKDDIYIDRSFISCFVYGTIDYQVFYTLCQLYKEMLGDCIKFVLVDTSVLVCCTRRMRNPKVYAPMNLFEAEKIRDKFIEAFDTLKKLGLRTIISKEGSK